MTLRWLCPAFALPPALALLMFASPLSATTFSVLNTNDSGPDSLRQALIAANADATATVATPHLITFAIPGAGVHTIAPTSQYPSITRPVVINGFSQTGSSANTLAVGNDSVHLIELDGENANITNGCFSFAPGSGGSVLRGLVMNRCQFGINITTGNIAIEGNFLGINPAGDTDKGLGSIGTSTGFSPDSGVVRIGGATPAQRNVIAGTSTSLVVNNLSGVTIQGNYIGLNAAGTAALGGQGVVFGTLGSTTIGAFTIGGATTTPGTPPGNVISGVQSSGITVTSSADTTVGVGTIAGNLIGLSADGTTAVPNLGFGITLNDSSFSADGTAKLAPVTIGGATATARNVISGNAGIGIGTVADGVVVQSNFIGTDISGSHARPNIGGGIEVKCSGFFAGTQTIGGVGRGNVISGNGGNAISVVTTTANIRGNLIGVAADGTSPLANPDAIGIVVNSALAAIGGTNAGEGNVVSGSGSYGIEVEIAASAIHNASNASILGNSIYQNGPASGVGGIGINLFKPDVVTPNDLGDADTGPSGLQNYPVITSATTAGAVQGTLNSVSNADFRIEFFASTTCDPSGFGEGQTFLGFKALATDASGNASFSVALGALPAGQSVVTATATDGNGNTSEFSQCLTASTPGKTTTTTSVVSSLNPSTVGQSVTFTATVNGAAPTGTVQFMDGATTLGAAVALSAATASVSTSALTAGTHPITAVYSGDANNTASTSPTLNQVVANPSPTPTSTAVTSSENPSTLGDTVTFTAQVNVATAASRGLTRSAVAAISGSVIFSDGATMLGSAPVSGGLATISTSTLTVGMHTIQAAYSGDATNAPSSGALVQQVGVTVTPPPATFTAAPFLSAWAAVSMALMLIAWGGLRARKR